MAKKIDVSNQEPTPDELVASQTVLEETPGRALRFLSAVSRTPGIRAALATRGYDNASHEQGWQLLWAATGAVVPGATTAAAHVDPVAQAALAEIDAWDEPNFRVIHAALHSPYPDQEAFLFRDDLEAAKGSAAIGTVKIMLDRLDALESGKGRPKDEHADDKSALAKLDKRGITKAVRAHLRDLLETATKLPPGNASSTDGRADTSASDETKRLAALNALRVWFEEWSEIAHIAVKRRDYLISLGIATRAKPEKPAPVPAPPASSPAAQATTDRAAKR